MYKIFQDFHREYSTTEVSIPLSIAIVYDLIFTDIPPVIWLASQNESEIILY